MTSRHLQTEILVPWPPERAFRVLCDPSNLDRLTPHWLRFQVLTPQPLDLGAGSVVDYRLTWHGLPLRWRSEITTWEPGRRCTYVQADGPYRHWEHDHLFMPEASGCRVVDLVRYRSRGGRLLDRLWIDREVAEIFEHRARVVGAMTRRVGPLVAVPPSPWTAA